MKIVSIWKCQDCGIEFPRATPGEPRRCPVCLSKSAKSFVRDKLIFPKGLMARPDQWLTVGMSIRPIEANREVQINFSNGKVREVPNTISSPGPGPRGERGYRENYSQKAERR